MSLSIRLGNFLYKHAFWLYRPFYTAFKNRQDQYERMLLKQLVRPGATVLDIGANIGYYATQLSQMVGETGKVHCFEPDQKNFNYLQAATRGLKNTVINNKAVAERSGQIKIYTSPELNVDHRTYKPEVFEKEIAIPCVSVDDYVKGAYKVDLIKLDIQGFEMNAIQGMEATISANRELVLLSEFWPYGLRTAGSSCLEYYEHLIKKGFTCRLLEKNSLSDLDVSKVKSLELLGKEHYFNILAIKGDVQQV